ncbi:MAG: hypothetical protein M9913_03115 [Bryobacteraceae bacterium]|nr:hypothetical protein [Solibacteraceae bacterium]MCO5349889.1 hypothetical protein [Bryobacteraceae bacterium]
MPQIAKAQPILTEEEWALVAQMLENKQRELLLGIRHSVRRNFRDELQRELSLVEGLRDRIPVHEEKE